MGDALGNQNSPSCSFASVLRGEQYTPRDAIFIEQEETRAVRTDKWLYMRRFNESRKYPLEDEMYNLPDDPNEQNDVLRNSEYAETAKELAQRIDNFFRKYSDPKYDLWHGGKVKSNSDRPYLWKDAWGESWRPLY